MTRTKFPPCNQEMYNFKKIQIVPEAKELVDIVLTRTQRKTPTVVHANYAIPRIRSFYMRKVKFAQQTFHDKLTQVLEDFPKVDDLHPFFADLLNVLYDKDHYKLALGQLNTARHIIDNLSKDYVRLMKFGDSLFKCKQLKRAALGRMCTLIRKQGPSFAYLEEVRKHLSRLPAIDPNTRSLLITGYPNVGKSSFMNKVTRADVDVQEYAFTTKSLFVGHTDYQYVRWQVIDSPGILDHPLEERNTIEMQSITALAHLQCCVLFFIDISERCGFTMEQQLSLFENIKPLFASKPLVIVATKIDLMPLEKLSPAHRAHLDKIIADSGALFLTMSNHTEEGVMDVRNEACKLLLAARVEQKMTGKKISDVVNRLTVTLPRPRDGKVRGPAIPPSVLAARAAEAAGLPAARHEELEHEMDADGDEMMERMRAHGRKLAKQIEMENGGPGVYRFDLSSHYDLKDSKWRTDVIPEIMDGKNILDYVDADILERLDTLEREEEAEEEAATAAREAEGETSEDEVVHEVAETIRTKKAMVLAKMRREKDRNHPRLNRAAMGMKAGEFAEHLEALGVDSAGIQQRLKEAKGVKRGRSLTRRGESKGSDDDMSDDGDDKASVGGKAMRTASTGSRKGFRVPRSLSKARAAAAGEAEEEPRSRSRSRARNASQGEPLPGEGFKNAKQKDTAYKLFKKKLRDRNREGRLGEGDRFVGTKMPRHLFSGKRPGQATAHHR